MIHLQRLALLAASLLVIAPIRAQTQHYYLTLQSAPDENVLVTSINDSGAAAGWVNPEPFCCDSSYLADQPVSWSASQERMLRTDMAPGLGAMAGGEANGINSAGQIWGVEFTGLQPPFTHAAVWTKGVVSDLGDLGGGWSQADWMNDAGVVVGVASVDPSSGTSHAFVWEKEHMSDLGEIGGGYSEATYVCRQGVISGFALTASGIDVPVLFENGTVTRLPSLAGPTGAAMLGTSELPGEQVGESDTALQGPGGIPFTHAALWKGTQLIDLGTLIGAKGNSSAVAVNASGTIIGTSDIPQANQEGKHYTHAVMWNNGAHIVDLGTLGGLSSVVTQVNAAGVIVGSATTAAGVSHAVLWQGGKIVDLHQEVSAQLPPNVILMSADSITDSGFIEATAYNPAIADQTGATTRGFYRYLLTPPIATQIAVSSTANPSIFGASVKLMAHVTAASGPDPVSAVTWMDGTTVLGTSGIGDDGMASFKTSQLSTGTHEITVSFDGRRPDGASTSSVFRQIVGPAPTRTRLFTSANPVDPGRQLTLTAAVRPESGTLSGGVVTFKAGNRILGTGNVNPATKRADLSLQLKPGTYAITAVYAGSKSFNSSESPILTQVVF